MSPEQLSPAATARPTTHWPTVLQVMFAGLGLLLFLSGAGVLFFGGIIALFTPDSNDYEAATLFTNMLSSIVMAILLLPAMVTGIFRLSSQDSAFSQRLSRLGAILQPRWLIWLLVLTIPVGYFLSPIREINWLFMPLIHVITLGLPVGWLTWLAVRKLPVGSKQRDWGAFSAGLILSPALIIPLEIGAFLLGVIVLAILSATNQELANTLNDLIQQIGSLAITQPAAQQALIEVLKRPEIIITLLAFISGIVPLIEEIFKPIAIWLLWKRPLTPVDGWVLGVLSGAGFALVENLGNISFGEGWAILGLARFGAAAMHIFSSGWFGYALVTARNKKRAGIAFLVYFAGVTLHAIWNAIAVLSIVSAPENLSEWPIVYLLGIALLSLGIIVGIYLTNRNIALQTHTTAEKSIEDHGNNRSTD